MYSLNTPEQGTVKESQKVPRGSRQPLFIWTGVLKTLSQLVPDVPQHLKLMDKLLSTRPSAPHVVHQLEADPYSSGLVYSRPSASWYQMSLSTSN